MAEKSFGVNFLHEHVNVQKALKVEKDHVIVDKKDWDLVCTYFQYCKGATERFEEWLNLDTTKGSL